MDRLLSELNKTPGVIGSFIVAPDGIIIASDFTVEVNEEMMGALMSSIINTTEKAAKKMEVGSLQGFVLETDRNRVFFQASKSGYIVCLAGPDANLGLLRVELRAAAERLSTAGSAR